MQRDICISNNREHNSLKATSNSTIKESGAW